MALTVSRLYDSGLNNRTVVMCELAFDSSYPTGGESFTPASVGLGEFDFVALQSKGGYQLEYDAANQKIKAYQPVQPITAESILITDADGAAAAGVVVYAHTSDGVTAHLEFVSPTNANGTCTLTNGGSTLYIKDSDAAAGGVQVYFDEDGTNADERLLIVSPTGADLLVPLANGTVIRLNHDADAATKGVAVYFDEDAANAYERLLFVSPTDEDGTGSTDDSYKLLQGVTQGAMAEVANATDLSSLTRIMAFCVGC